MADADTNHSKMIERKKEGEDYSYFEQYDKIFRAVGWIPPKERGATPDNPTLTFNIPTEDLLKKTVTVSRGKNDKRTLPVFVALAYMDNILKYKEDLYSRLKDFEKNRKKVSKDMKGFLN